METARNPVSFLLVEDDEDHADLIMRSMRDNRIFNEINHVTDGEKALAYLRRQAPYEEAKRPDVVLLDLKMPRVDGHEVLRVVKSDPQLAPIPVVIMTTSEAESDRVQAYAAHANSYLVKPLDFDSFHKLVQELKLYWAAVNTPPFPVANSGA
ncbi:MAG: response regulator [Phycisphaerales bacterium]